MRMVSFALAISFVATAGLFWYVNAANGYAFIRTGNDVAAVVVAGVFPWLLALRKSITDPSDVAAWVFTSLSVAAALLFLGTLPSGEAVSYNSAFFLVTVWGSYGLSRCLVRMKQNSEQ